MDPFYNLLVQLCGQYSARMHAGPPLAEHEYLLYQSITDLLTALTRNMANHLPRPETDE